MTTRAEIDPKFLSSVCTTGVEAACIVTTYLTGESAWFETMPLPDNRWQIIFKSENQSKVDHLIDFLKHRYDMILPTTPSGGTDRDELLRQRQETIRALDHVKGFMDCMQPRACDYDDSPAKWAVACAVHRSRCQNLKSLRDSIEAELAALIREYDSGSEKEASQ